MGTKIHVLHCGYIKIAKYLTVSGGRFTVDIVKAAIAPDRGRITLPVSVYLIECSAGLYLVDAGLDRDISPDGEYDRKAAEKVLPKHLAALYHPFVPLGMTITEQLEAKEIRPEDIKAVLITHLDVDHVSGLRSLDRVQRIIIPEDEAYWSVRTKYRMRQARNLWETTCYERLFYRGCQLGPMKRAIDVIGDGSIMMVNLPGHTDGQAGVLVREGNRSVLIAADAAFSPRNWEKMQPAGLGIDTDLQKKTLKWIAKTAADPACARVLCSHDTGVQTQTIDLCCQSE